MLFTLCENISNCLFYGQSLSLTKSRVEHVKRHLIALRSTRNGDQSLVAVVLWLVDLDDTATKLAYLIDLRSTLADDRSNHVVRNEDLLRKRLAWNNALHRLVWWASMRCGTRPAMLSRLLRANATVASCRLASIMERSLWHLWLETLLHLRLSISVGWALSWVMITTSLVIRMAVVAASWLWHIWNYLHTAWDDTGRPTTAGSICRGGRTAEALSELLEESASNIICSNMNRISDTEHD